MTIPGDGGTGCMTPLTDNDRRVMVERAHGWEGASGGLLAKVFGVSVQQATAIIAGRCKACGRAVCGHSDPVFAGVVPHAGEPA